ncbi:MAG: DUF805 domain-containing protein [Acetobacteraceae bacterium]|nr:DUF805 domain-containing protein [Acetobacteraceae bacterium]
MNKFLEIRGRDNRTTFIVNLFFIFLAGIFFVILNHFFELYIKLYNLTKFVEFIEYIIFTILFILSCVRRQRDTGKNIFWVLLSVVPFLNLVFFTHLLIAKSSKL